MTLNDRMDFDHVIRVHADGTVTDERETYGPENVLMNPDLSIDMDGADGWSLMNGYSGQDRYSGPVMHESEYIGGGMERDILATPGLYVAVIVYADPDEDDDPADGNPIAGWTVAYREED